MERYVMETIRVLLFLRKYTSYVGTSKIMIKLYLQSLKRCTLQNMGLVKYKLDTRDLGKTILNDKD